MKRQFTLSIAFAPGNILVSLTKIGSGTLPLQSRFAAGRGIIGLGQREAISVALQGDFNGDGDVDATDFLVFKRVGYVEADNIYKFAAQGAPAPLTLAVGETASLNLVATTYGRGIILTRSGEARVTRSTQVASVFQKICWFGSLNTRASIRFIEKTPGQIIGILIAL